MVGVGDGEFVFEGGEDGGEEGELEAEGGQFALVGGGGEGLGVREAVGVAVAG